MIEPKFDAARVKGGSTGFIKSRVKAAESYRTAAEKEFKKQQKDAKAAKDKRSASAKKGAATRAANKKAAATTTTTVKPATQKPATAPKGLPGTVPGQAGGAKGRPASQTAKVPVAGKPPRAPKQTAPKTTRTPPAKGTKPVGKVGPVTKPTQRGRAR